MTDPYKTAAQHRDTPLHLISFRVHVDGIYVVCAVRDATPDVISDPTSPTGNRLKAKRVPELPVLFSELSDDENAQARALCILLETKVAAKVAAYQDSPDRQAAKVSEALDAENRLKAAKEAAERIADEAVVERKRLEIEAQAMRDAHAAEMKQLSEAADRKRAELAALEAQHASATAPPTDMQSKG